MPDNNELTVPTETVSNDTISFELFNGTERGLNWEVMADKTVVLVDDTTILTDCSAGNHFRVTLAGSRTLGNPTNPRDGGRYVWEFIQDSTGSRVITLGSKFAFGSSPSSLTLTTTPSARDLMGAIYNATTDKFYVVATALGFS